jgi:hypothetical protein
MVGGKVYCHSPAWPPHHLHTARASLPSFAFCFLVPGILYHHFVNSLIELKLTWNKLLQLDGESCNRFDQLSEPFPHHKSLQKLSTLLISSNQPFKFWGISSSSCQVSKNKVTIVTQDHSQVLKWEQWKTTADCRKYVYCTWHIGTGRCVQNVVKTSAEYYIYH